jgi:flagella basal body P-ring formation protein FlgA
VPRVFRPAELRSIADRYGLQITPEHRVCAKRPIAPLDPQVLLDAMQRTFPTAHIDLLEFSRVPAPDGEIEFPPTGFQAPVNGSGAGIWRGWVRYGANHRFSIWARVTLTVKASRVVAKTDLAPGQLLRVEDVEARVAEEPPTGSASAPQFPESLEEVVGRCARQPIRAGQAIRKLWIANPKVVRAGENVKVMVNSANTQLEFEGAAENSGAVGDMVFVRNTSSHRRFRARVEAAGRVSVDPTAPAVQRENQ